ncbi:uncharacterized protein LOC132725948 [Ruditapes philippinarum]|uniref:uncharacterized protein LOC132725948 n=1 Tax=Ruditapes philippinarum TaxID=129788 RepID=UPI00295C24FF|nr:uncharacterized protein LOC132725948 [Ruditapes philippinarum]
MRNSDRMNAPASLVAAILFTCILGACAQTRGRRIITRIHSNELVIPLHHKQNAIDMKTGKAYAPNSCGTGCPPQWVDVVHSMAGLVPNVSEPMCEFADKFSPCYHEGDVCPKNLVEFTCCPSRCMPSVDACYHGNPPEFLCVPKSIQPWLGTIFRLNIWDPNQHYQ